MIWQQADCQKEVLCGRGTGGVIMHGDLRNAQLEPYYGRVQCVYLDPPFFTGDEFTFRMRVGKNGWETGAQTLVLPAYSDSKTGGKEAYLQLLRDALEKAHLLLSDTGALFLHLDSRMNAYARLLCDEIFGESNFVNEIIRAYQSGGRAKRHFSRKHDVILFYAKSRALYFDITRVGLPRKDNRSNHMRRTVDESGRPCRTIKTGGKVYTYYDDEPVFPDDVWADVSHLQQKDPQRTGYDTQKPQALLNRIVRCCTREGDLVADLFCGSGTTLVAASDNKCRFLGVDASRHAVSVTHKRLLDTELTVDTPTRPVHAALRAEVLPGLGYYEITLEDYQLPEGMEQVQQHLPGVPLTGLDLVDQWAVGFLRDGEFRGYAASARRKQTPEIDRTLELPLLRGEVAILVIDVLGNRSVWTAETEE